MESGVRIVEKKDGKILAVAGGNYRIIISGDETNNTYAVIEMIVPPGGGPPPHAHPYIQETFYVLDGEVEFKTEDGKRTVKTGGYIDIPLGGAIHSFKNISQSNATLLCTVMPAGLEKLFEALGPVVEAGQFLPAPPLTPERRKLLEQLEKTYQQTTYPPDFLD